MKSGNSNVCSSCSSQEQNEKLLLTKATSAKLLPRMSGDPRILLDPREIFATVGSRMVR